eukprot:CAMPEP_0175434344 /NCGR_PEP_ID=MMETSP0095-20121207/53855_1 /TAXON_ID=311494 /ORGANISM="Alexandrium monilatum, Strain CCMP3105" /LENGTH=79 /DNA_ID=CAMNT_0016733881 /DNA_START=9 /DNA_END=245 /DNA_ORIENTATION=+
MMESHSKALRVSAHIQAAAVAVERSRSAPHSDEVPRRLAKMPTGGCKSLPVAGETQWLAARWDDVPPVRGTKASLRGKK